MILAIANATPELKTYAQTWIHGIAVVALIAIALFLILYPRHERRKHFRDVTR